MAVTKEKVLEALSHVYDPEIPIDIVNLGLVYDIAIDGDIVDALILCMCLRPLQDAPKKQS
jgi:metal-sulfur cluster biosynthetic enzyme